MKALSDNVASVVDIPITGQGLADDVIALCKGRDGGDTVQVAVGGGLAISQSATAAEEGDLGAGISLGVQSYTFRNFDLEPALKRIQLAAHGPA